MKKLDHTLEDACNLLGEMGTCTPSKTNSCSDFKKARSSLEKLCNMKEKRDEKKHDPSDWVSIGKWQYKKWKFEDYETIIYIVIAFFPMAIFYTLVHELGHVLVAVGFGWEVIDFKIALFPLVLDSLDGYVVALVPFTTPDWQIILFYAGGSLHSLIWAYIFFVIFYNFKLHRFAEILLVTYSIILGLDAISYIFSDVFYSQSMDWWHVYQYSPIVVGVVLSLSILNMILFTAYFKKIKRRMNIFPD